MRFVTKALALVVSMATISGTTACLKKAGSSVKTIESKDWFRKGKDRFYLAQLAGDAGDGQEVLVGIGCYGEKDGYWEAEDPARPGQRFFTRRYFHTEDPARSDFPMAKDPAKPNAGECVVLLGDHGLALTHSQLRKEGSLTGPAVMASMSAMGVAVSAATCGTCVAAMLKMPDKAKAGAACVGVNALSFFLSGGINGLMAATGAQKPIEAGANTAISFVPCGDLAQTLFYLGQDGKSTRNREVFFETIGRSITYAYAAALQEDRAYADVIAGRPSSHTDTQKLALIRKLNGDIVTYFNGARGNRDTFTHMEQGWGGFDEQGFFKLVKEINEEMKAALERTKGAAGQGGNAPAGSRGNGAGMAPSIGTGAMPGNGMGGNGAPVPSNGLGR